MISGNKEREIASYQMIDRLGSGICWVEPVTGTETEGEQIIGIPCGWIGEDSPPFIEHRKNGVVTKSVNCADVSKIEFWIHIKPYSEDDDE